MLGALRKMAFTTISNNRDSVAVKVFRKAALFVDSAYRNEGSDFEQNGERRMLDLLRQFNFSVAFDIGANSGSWSSAAAQSWNDCTIHAFEIAPTTAEKFADNIARSGLAQVKLHKFGMSEEVSSVKMYYFPENDELTCSAPRHGHMYASTEFVANVLTVDSFCEKNAISHIDFMKIDVEGDEYKVLRGAKAMLEQGEITCLQFEYGAFSTSSRFLLRDYYEILADKFHIGKIYPRYVDFTEYNWQMEDFRFCNYVAVSKDRDDIRRALAR